MHVCTCDCFQDPRTLHTHVRLQKVCIVMGWIQPLYLGFLHHELVQMWTVRDVHSHTLSVRQSAHAHTNNSCVLAADQQPRDCCLTSVHLVYND